MGVYWYDQIPTAVYQIVLSHKPYFIAHITKLIWQNIHSFY